MTIEQLLRDTYLDKNVIVTILSDEVIPNYLIGKITDVYFTADDFEPSTLKIVLDNTTVIYANENVDITILESTPTDTEKYEYALEDIDDGTIIFEGTKSMCESYIADLVGMGWVKNGELLFNPKGIECVTLVKQ